MYPYSYMYVMVKSEQEEKCTHTHVPVSSKQEEKCTQTQILMQSEQEENCAPILTCRYRAKEGENELLLMHILVQSETWEQDLPLVQS
jgi:hypothetical protein